MPMPAITAMLRSPKWLANSIEPKPIKVVVADMKTAGPVWDMTNCMDPGPSSS